MQIFRTTGFLFFLAGVSGHVAALAEDVVPLTFIGDIPFVTVKVGAASSRMMIDSGGALGISLTQATVDKAGSVTVLPQKTRFSDVNGALYEVPNLLARGIVVGATQLAAVDGRLHVLWGGAPPGSPDELTKARHDGAIGLAAFGPRALMFDYRRAAMTIYAPGEPPQAVQQGWHTLRLDYGKEGPNVTLVVGGKPLKFVLDTGAQVNIVNTDSLAPGSAQAPCGNPAVATCDPRELGPVRDSSGRLLGSMSAERGTLAGAPFDGLLGAPFFQRYRVLFDLPGKRLLIAPHDAK